MGRVLPIATGTERVLACNICGGVEHGPVFRKFGYDLVRCASCGLVFVGNPLPQDLMCAPCADFADRPAAPIDPSTRAFAAMRRVARQNLKMLRRSTGVRRGLRLFDVGRSNGLFLVAALQAGFEVHGDELACDAAAFARSHFGLDVHLGDWRGARHGEGAFDVVTLFDGVGHLPDPLGELTAIRRLLRPGGWLLQSAPNIDGLYPRLSYALAHRLDYWPHPDPPGQLYQFSDRTLAEITERAGYEVTRIDQARIPLGCSFGTPRSRKPGPGMLVYAALFAPVALLGPWLGMGDRLYLSARRPG